jgi:Phospholipid methyltransferase
MRARRAYLVEILVFVVIVPLMLAAASRAIDNYVGLGAVVSFGRAGRHLGAVVAALGLIVWGASPLVLLLAGKGPPLEGLGRPLAGGTRQLVRRGPYRFVRNPMYIGYLTLLAAIALLIDSPVMLFGAVPAWALWMHYFVVHFEERSLAARFGDAYRDYQAAVPRWVPRLTRSGRSPAATADSRCHR